MILPSSPAFDQAEPIGVVLVEDEPTTQDHLAELLEASPRVKLLGVASNAQEAYSLLFMTRPKVALIDLGLPDTSGIEVIRWLHGNKPEVEPLVITTFGDETHILQSLEAGATGYLLKDCTHLELVEQIVEVTEGGSPISPLVARQLLSLVQQKKFPDSSFFPDSPPRNTGTAANRMTERELAVLQQVSRGFTVQEIAEQMGISAHTVATHVKRIYRKLHVHSRSEAVFEASLLGLLDF